MDENRTLLRWNFSRNLSPEKRRKSQPVTSDFPDKLTADVKNYESFPISETSTSIVVTLLADFCHHYAGTAFQKCFDSNRVNYESCSTS